MEKLRFLYILLLILVFLSNALSVFSSFSPSPFSHAFKIYIAFLQISSIILLILFTITYGQLNIFSLKDKKKK